MRLNVRVIAFVLAVFSSAAACVDTLAQENSTTYLSGSIQSDMLFPQADSVIGTGAVTDKFLSNTYLNLNFGSQYVDAGARLELLNKPLPGFEKEFAGAGIPNFYVTGKFKNNTLTVGNFYDQYGVQGCSYNRIVAYVSSYLAVCNVCISTTTSQTLGDSTSRREQYGVAT